MIQFRLDSTADGVANMAADCELLALAETGVCAARIYFWDGPWVSLGRHQNPDKVLKSNRIPYVMRPTGGKAVLHGHDLTIGLALPLRDLGLTDFESRSVTRVYRQISQFITRSLTEDGIPSDLGESKKNGEDAKPSEDCFAAISKNDIIEIATGKKICGCALKLTSDAVLLQASIPISEPLVHLNEVFDDASDPYWINLDQARFAKVFRDSLNRSAPNSPFLS